MIWLEPSTGKICHMISAMALYISWGNTPMYWGWETRRDSRFGRVAVLKKVCFLNILGNIDCSVLLVDTKYRVSFLVKMSEGAHGWHEHPAILSIKLPDRNELQNSQMLDTEGISRISSDRHTEDGWICLVAGEFTVQAPWETEQLEFSLTMNALNWKSGLILDGVMLEPLSVIDRQ